MRAFILSALVSVLRVLNFWACLTVISIQVCAAAENSCGFVQLDRPGESFSHIPVHQQGNVGICYAESAAQLLDAFRFSHGDHSYEKLTSGLQAAMSLNLDINRLQFEGGNICKVFSHMIAAGVCDERAVFEVHKMKINRKKFISFLEQNYNSYHARLKELGIKTNDPTSDLLFDNRFDSSLAKKAGEQRKAMTAVTSFLLNAGLPQRLIPPPRELGSLLDQNSFLGFVQGILMPTCTSMSPRTSSASSQMPQCVDESVRKVGPSGLVKLINQNLSLPNPQPVGIGYCSDILRKGKSYRGMIYDKRGGRCTGKSDGSGHASLIIGRRYNRKTWKCQYRIRNSWGRNCRKYSRDWDCDKGNIWVDGDTLKDSLREVYYLQ